MNLTRSKIAGKRLNDRWRSASS